MLGFVSLVSVYAPTKMCETEENMFYTKLNSLLDQCPSWGTLTVLDDFSAMTGPERAGFELFEDPHDWHQEHQMLSP